MFHKKKIKFVKLDPNAFVPKKGSTYSAGFDLFACVSEPIEVNPEQTVYIPTGLAFEVPKGYAGFIYARSGLASKKGLRPANCVGVCDSDYRGEYIVAIHNDSNSVQIVKPYERIAQVVFAPYLDCKLVRVKKLSDTKRNIGGFGSTGV